MAKTVWKDEYYVSIYELARQGMADKQMAPTLGVNILTFKKWKRDKPAVRDALKRARALNAESKKGGDTFRDYVFKRLPPELQELWTQLQECEELPNGIRRVEALLRNAGQDTRMHLFLYALVNKNFNVSEACRSVNISRKTYESWCTTLPEFSELIDEMHEHKKNFYEEGLVRLVKCGDPSAIIFANKTFNRDRGYSDKLEVQVNGQVEHKHAHVMITVDQLDLPVDVRRLILEKLREKQNQLTLEEASA